MIPVEFLNCRAVGTATELGNVGYMVYILKFGDLRKKLIQTSCRSGKLCLFAEVPTFMTIEQCSKPLLVREFAWAYEPTG